MDAPAAREKRAARCLNIIMVEQIAGAERQVLMFFSVDMAYCRWTCN
jgi:hypothetical protein